MGNIIALFGDLAMKFETIICEIHNVRHKIRKAQRAVQEIGGEGVLGEDLDEVVEAGRNPLGRNLVGRHLVGQGNPQHP